MTDQEIEIVKKELINLEPIFHHQELGTSKEILENMISDDYWEVGASGKVYTKKFIIDTLIERYSKSYSEDLEMINFRCQKIENNSFFVTYKLIQNKNRYTNRVTIWKKVNGYWKALYHQGTIIEEKNT